MEIQSLGIHIGGFVPGLRAGDPVTVTIQLPEGPVTLEAWCAETRTERYDKGFEHTTRITWYPPRRSRDLEIDDGF